jgi:hypothetical protein
MDLLAKVLLVTKEEDNALLRKLLSQTNYSQGINLEQKVESTVTSIYEIHPVKEKNMHFIEKAVHTLKKDGVGFLIKKAFAYTLRKVQLYWYFVRFLIKSPRQITKRYNILKRFRSIHKAIPSAHSETELLHIADEILKVPSNVKGDIIECGTWKGGSTCKLSIVAKMTGRKLIACDSFEGLPEPEEHDKVHIHSNGKIETYKKGDYAASIEEVEGNLRKFGEPESVELVKGWFHETLPKLRNRRAILVFIDVDLQESIKCCLENLWPVLVKRCKFFTHEAHHIQTVKLIANKDFWKKLGEDKPPNFIGAVMELGESEPCLGYLQK